MVRGAEQLAAGRASGHRRRPLPCRTPGVGRPVRHHAIVARLRAGAQSKEDAAQAAIRAIESVISQGKDSVLDNIAQFFEGVGDLLAGIGRWVTDVIKGVLDTLSDIWNALLPKIMAVLLLALIPIVLGWRDSSSADRCSAPCSPCSAVLSR